MLKVFHDFFRLVHLIVFSILVSILSSIALAMLAISDTFHAYAVTADMLCEEASTGVDVLAGLTAIVLEILAVVFSIPYRLFASLISLTFWRHMHFQIVTHTWEFGTQPEWIEEEE